MQLSRNNVRLEFISVLLLYTAYFIIYFSPSLLNNLLLAPGDGRLSYLPFFTAGDNRLWTDLLLGGYSLAGEIQAQLFYLPRLLSPTYNVLVISSFVISALGSYYLARTISGSIIGGVFAGFLVSSSGFMIAHLGHLTIIHSAAWIPWLLLAVYKLPSQRSVRWICLGALFAALSIMAGHPQIAVYGYLVAGLFAAYLATFTAYHHNLRSGAVVIGKTAIMFALALALSAPSWLPFALSVGDGARADWSIADFASFSHSFKTLILLFAPDLYGAAAGGPYGVYSGPGNLTEIAIYVGLLPWILLLSLPLRRFKLIAFWLACLVLSVVYVLGTSTPFGDFVYHLPGLGKFRAQARFGIITAICFAIISATAIRAIEESEISRKRLTIAVTIFLVTFGVAITLAVANTGIKFPDASFRGVLYPIIIAAVTFLLVQWLVSFTNAKLICLSFIALIIIDLGSFGWFYEWRYAGVGTAAAHPDADANERTAFMKQGGRIFPIDSPAVPEGPLRPNVNMIYGLPLVVGYVSTMPKDLGALFEAQNYGAMSFYGLNSPSLDILGVRWIAYENDRLAVHVLANGCGEIGKIRDIRASVPKGVRVRAVRLISSTSCSVDLSSGTVVARLGTLDPSLRPIQRFDVLLGKDTAEWSYDKPKISANIRHSRAKVFSTFGFSPGNRDGLWFISEWPVSNGADARMVDLEMSDGGPPLNVLGIDVLTESGQTLPLRLEYFGRYNKLLVDSGKVLDGVRIAERPNYRGLVWGVCGLKVVDNDALLKAVRSGDIGGGSRFDPFAEVLIGDPAFSIRPTCRQPPSVKVLAKQPGKIRVRASGDGYSVLVFSQHYDPGWTAHVNGMPVKVIAADGAVLGVAVGPGVSDVVVQFHPRGLRLGLWLCLLALLGMVGYVVWYERGVVRRMVKRH